MTLRQTHRLLPAVILLAFLTGGFSTSAHTAATPRDPSPHTELLAARPAAPRRTSPRASAKLLTDPYAVYEVPQVPKPRYLDPVLDPTFGTAIIRVGSDPGKSTGLAHNKWAEDARHTYSLQQPWSSDNSLLVIENRVPGKPSPLFLDGTSYQPLYETCDHYDYYDYRWHPSPAHPHEQINVNAAGTELMWFDVTTCLKTRSWNLPIVVDYGIGSGKGNPSNDGRYVALGNHTAMFVVDMDPQPPYAPYPNVRIGPVYTFPPESLTTAAPDSFTMDHLSVSPSGKYVDVKFGSADDCGSFDMHRIFDVDAGTLALRPHAMAAGALRCCSFQGRPNGWIFPLKHADLASDPFDGHEDILVGGRSCPGSELGPVVKVRLRDGAVTALTSGDNQSSVFHVSTRNVDRPGWAYVSWYKAPGKRFSDEIVAVKLDGSGWVERLCHMHSADASCYRCEPHPVPSRDGSRVLFASNWAQDCGSVCGDSTDLKDYIVTDGASFGTSVPLSGAPQLALNQIRPNPARLGPSIEYSLASWEPARIELVDVAGRTVLDRELGTPGPGRHALSLWEAGGVRTGLYIVRLMQAGQSVSSKLVLRQ